jgi:hypothetical protein
VTAALRQRAGSCGAGDVVLTMGSSDVAAFPTGPRLPLADSTPCRSKIHLAGCVCQSGRICEIVSSRSATKRLKIGHRSLSDLWNDCCSPARARLRTLPSRRTV